MQLDVGVSPPANIMAFRPGLTYLTFDLDPRDLFLVRQMDRQTDGQTYRRTDGHGHRWAQKSLIPKYIDGSTVSY